MSAHDAWALVCRLFAGGTPVLRAHDIVCLWREPALLERVRVGRADVRVITPKPRKTRGAPFGPGVEWLALEDRFALYGGGIAFIAPPDGRNPVQAVDPTVPVHGPFSDDFTSRWLARRRRARVDLIPWSSKRDGQPMATTHVQVTATTGGLRVLWRKSWHRF
ncbi:MAG: hypothetical protein ACUVVU_09125 [Tepidimonas sp.]|uniref:hypothetical protein n=1 Tax=Tepidimonas sp. TaxID=2002775 RepID=UPI004055288A